MSFLLLFVKRSKFSNFLSQLAIRLKKNYRVCNVAKILRNEIEIVMRFLEFQDITIKFLETIRNLLGNRNYFSARLKK